MATGARANFVSPVGWLLGLIVWTAVSPGWAQEATTEDPAEGVGISSKSSASEAVTPAVSQSERMRRLEQVIEADKAKLEEVKQDLVGREAFFDQLTESIEDAERELARKRQRLAELGGADALGDGAELAAEIRATEELLAAARRQSEITFESARTLQGQIRSLEQKIRQDEKALEEIIGQPAEESVTATQPMSATTASERAPEPVSVPGLPGVALIEATSSESDVEGEEAVPETAEQIEARRQAEEAEKEARKAEAAVVNFVERKASLESQIEMEQQLVQAARDSRENLRTGLEGAQAELNRLISADAGRAELQRARRTIDTIQDLLQESQGEIDRRREYLDTLYGRLEALQEEQLAITQEAEERRLEAAEARQRSLWLESPLHPANLWRWIRTRGPRMLLVILVAWVLLMLVRLSARRVARTVVGTRDGKQSRGANRADTLALSFRSAVSLLIVVAGVLLVFQEAGVDIKTVLGGAAILGVALAFGAQNLMRDYFTGFMILLEDQYELGDLVTIGSITGRVEKVNMRTTVLRDLEGRVHFIPNGEIKSVTNRTYVWGRAVLDIPIGYRENVDRAMALILEVAEEFRADPEVGDWVTDDPVMLGVDKFTEEGVIIKFMIQTKPDRIFLTRRELLRRVKNKFDDEGIRISMPHRILIQDPAREER